MKEDRFKEMDEKLMSQMKPLREHRVSDGILKGFSTSVERRLRLRHDEPRTSSVARFAWAPVLAVMVLASVLVLRSPVAPVGLQPVPADGIELAQVVVDEDVQDDIAILSELGLLDDALAEELLGEEEMLGADVELTSARPSAALA